MGSTITRQPFVKRLGRWLAVQVVLTTLFVLPAAAKDCLVFEFAESKAPIRLNISANFVLALRKAGICAEVRNLPAQRGLIEVKAGRLDGSVLRVPSAKEFFGEDAVMIGEQLASASGLLISRDPAVTSMDHLAGRTVGVRLGIKWQMDMVPATVVVASTPEYANLILMLRKRHIDAVLLDSVVAEAYAADLTDFTKTKLVDLTAYPWIRSGLRHRTAEIAAALRAFRATGREFTDPAPLIN